MSDILVAVQQAKNKTEFANVCGVSRQAVYKWLLANKLPRTEWTGETNYAEKIFNEYGIAVNPFVAPNNCNSTNKS